MRHLSLITSIIRDSGVIAVDRPSINYPIAVNLFYTYNADGSIRCIWPKGNMRPSFLTRYRNKSTKWTTKLHRLFFAVGLASMLPYCRVILYTDVPTATYLQKQWCIPA